MSKFGRGKKTRLQSRLYKLMKEDSISSNTKPLSGRYLDTASKHLHFRPILHIDKDASVNILILHGDSQMLNVAECCDISLLAVASLK